MLQHANGRIRFLQQRRHCIDHHAFRESRIHVISFCNLIGGALSEPLEVNGLNPPMLPGSFLLHMERGNEPGDKATGRKSRDCAISLCQQFQTLGRLLDEPLANLLVPDSLTVKIKTAKIFLKPEYWPVMWKFVPLKIIFLVQSFAEVFYPTHKPPPPPPPPPPLHF